ncbi:hypothetical protein [Mesoplasma corruscae]|uniref:YokE-like PH domain-containing protein n=1 Tax=Mesoplasma corruscae TaxID=216874 RepID=A0A2S5RG36_9MOLU|nr:hypothetical protein [Mesoplasma corruscae]PPE06182.1 hypothetical protein MCORR_v1c04860 [Mesoplasma corruscae]
MSLVNTKEYKYLEKLLFENETIKASIVGEIESIAYLVAFTQSRLFLVKKQIDIFVEVQQFGLEEIFDIKINFVGDIFDVVLYVKDKPIIKIDYLEANISKDFSKKLFEAINLWINNI